MCLPFRYIRKKLWLVGEWHNGNVLHIYISTYLWWKQSIFSFFVYFKCSLTYCSALFSKSCTSKSKVVKGRNMKPKSSCHFQIHFHKHSLGKARQYRNSVEKVKSLRSDHYDQNSITLCWKRRFTLFYLSLPVSTSLLQLFFSWSFIKCNAIYKVANRTKC